MKKKLLRIFSLSKRQRFVALVLVLSISFFLSSFLGGTEKILTSFFLSLLSVIVLYFILRQDLQSNRLVVVFILPFLYTFSFSLFFLLVPQRLVSIIFATVVYALGLYSLFLTQNIFIVSSIRTISLMRSARIVSFVLTIIVLFFLTNIIFSLDLPFFVPPFLVGITTFFLSIQSLWIYILDKSKIGDIVLSSLPLAVALFQLSFALVLWPVSGSIYSIFLTGIFYTYSGLSHVWIEKRLFRGIMWEYIWVGFLSVLILLVFSNWGI